MTWLAHNWLYVLAVVAIFAGLITLAVLGGGWIWYRHTSRMPELPSPPADDTPWGPALDGLVSAYDWDAAEQQMPRKLRRQP